jgi:hypothetical protein
MKSRKAKLDKEGWVKRTTINEPKLSEIVGEYERLGFEVLLEPINLDECAECCRKCFGNDVDKFRNIYVRRRRC